MKNTQHILDVIIEQHSIIAKDEFRRVIDNKQQILESILPVEKKSVQYKWPESVIPYVDPNLYEKYPIVDVQTILGMTGTTYRGVPTPRFAFYSVDMPDELKVGTGKWGNDRNCSIHYVKYREKMKNFSLIPKSNTFNVIAIACVVEIIAAIFLAIIIHSVFFFGILAGIAAICTTLGAFGNGCIECFSTSFSGIIPIETKKRMKEASRINPDLKFYILQEEIKWNANIKSPKDDHLLVAHAFIGNVYYLVDKFDTTSYEEYVGRYVHKC